MASIRMTLADMLDLEGALRSAHPRVAPKELTQALAKSLSFSTEDGLWAEILKISNENLPDYHLPYRLLNASAFYKALPPRTKLQTFAFDIFEKLVPQVPGLLSTCPERGQRIGYKSKRERAWRALMVCAINAGLKQRLFTLSLHTAPHPANEHQFFDFKLPGEIPARGSFRELAYGELSLFAAMRPTGRPVWGVGAGSLAARDAYGNVWLDRTNGAWVEPFFSTFSCSASAQDKLCAMSAVPLGFGDNAG